MNLRVGFELVFSCSQHTPMLLMLNMHSSHVNDVIVPDRVRIDRPLSLTQYHDSFGNLCSRIVTPSEGYLTLSTEALLNVSDSPERPAPDNSPESGGASTRRVHPVSPGKQILRNRPAIEHGMGDV
ncbi:hypothetical protein FVF58_49250 [Paraburkholderia panacisoli]|uniref:Uncharacterized protein n=1 Tax=Paraburkholderia panacisoli TaxID=2603818 RepID=A0A5B0G436_9BURK|nr:hypothetical protein FVF58_49250 [Paraburkholderia panacisoli]